jgi:hypothetical protein
MNSSVVIPPSEHDQSRQNCDPFFSGSVDLRSRYFLYRCAGAEAGHHYRLCGSAHGRLQAYLGFFCAGETNFIYAANRQKLLHELSLDQMRNHDRGLNLYPISSDE